MSNLVLRVGAKALIRHEDKFLLLREGAANGTQIGKYQIPGGMVELGEPFMDALLREVKEETGLKVNPILPIMVEGWMPTIEGVPHQIIAVFYLCEAESDKVALSHEHDKFDWIRPEELKNYDVPHPVPQLFAKYQELSTKNWGEL
jgi:8-oxo-dGTP diphosphatase